MPSQKLTIEVSEHTLAKLRRIAELENAAMDIRVGGGGCEIWDVESIAQAIIAMGVDRQVEFAERGYAELERRK